MEVRRLSHMGGMAPSSWGMMRSMRRKDELSGKKIGRETALRVLQFARPYRWFIGLFLVLVVISSGIAVATPVLAGEVINAITGKASNAGRVNSELSPLVSGDRSTA